MTSKELEHYGILGMKWGVRRYQNDDGTLTVAGKKRYNKVSESQRLQKSHTRQAVKILTEKKKTSDERERVAVKRIANLQKKITLANHEYASAMDSKDYKKASKAQKNIQKYREEAMKTVHAGKYFVEESEAAGKKLDDIQSGRSKAGRDFIVQTDWNLYPTPVGIFINRERKILYK